jgi:flagellar biosynthesis component FlhA
MEAVNVKQEARRLIDKLPDDATWDDVMHEIYVRQAIEAGLADSNLSRRREAVRRINGVREKLSAKYGEMPNSVELVREIREDDK